MTKFKGVQTINPYSNQLFELAQKGTYTYLRTRLADDIIKINLIKRTIFGLNKNGILAFEIDARNIVTPNKTKFYQKLIIDIGLSTLALPLEEKPGEWFIKNNHLTLEKQLSNYLEDVLLEQLIRPIVIIINNIQAIHLQPYSKEFFALIKSYYNARSADPKWRNITFILQGTLPRWNLIQGFNTASYNIGQFITLDSTNLLVNKPVKILYSYNDKFHLKPYMWFNYEASTYLRVWWLWFQIDITDCQVLNNKGLMTKD